MTRCGHGQQPKCDRAFELHERGISNAAIAERLGIKQSDVSDYVKSGKVRREKASAKVMAKV